MRSEGSLRAQDQQPPGQHKHKHRRPKRPSELRSILIFRPHFTSSELVVMVAQGILTFPAFFRRTQSSHRGGGREGAHASADRGPLLLQAAGSTQRSSWYF